MLVTLWLNVSLASALRLGGLGGPSGVGTRMALAWGDQPKQAHGWSVGI